VAASRFPFAFTPAYRLAAAAFGVTPARAWVEVDTSLGLLTARYGPWLVRTDLGNVLGTHITGPYSVPRTIGPARLSFADRGLTMAGNPHRGLCIQFVEPVPGIEPTGRITHPALTVTVADCAALAAVLAAPGAAGG
jgi:hypothetical protein